MIGWCRGLVLVVNGLCNLERMEMFVIRSVIWSGIERLEDVDLIVVIWFWK